MDRQKSKLILTRRRVLITATCIAAAGLAVLYSTVDPSTNLYPRCSFKMLTGLSCPGCGSQRALHSLLNGHLAEAFRFNALFIVEIPLIALLLGLRYSGKRGSHLRHVLGTQTFILLILATIIIWTVVRNILEI